ncbi:hypothetical protein CDD81_2395 [Ophiocordyceps australis]|uniref:Heterokaryon incompatibility domain-containing protein n=1 Tax=Ophiocordyceps australis TaxID=1399860 RepID=A0A2C5XTY6_9HYPO|nr:hypothetical protein CDD81_2395 [Ophiocordyceps australis]
MELCSYCSRIPAKLFSFRRSDQSDYDHQPTLAALQQSASAGCQGCRLFMRAIETSTERYAGKYALARPWEQSDAVRLSSTKFGWQVVRVGWKEAGHFRAMAIPKEWSGDLPSYPAAGKQDACMRLQHEAALLQRWLNICRCNHKCLGPGTAFLPTRLLDVGTRHKPRLFLVQSADLHAEATSNKYIALSHCWGLTMPASGKTTLATLNNHRASVRAQGLPRTFQDVIEIARRLGVGYVWIDSLCIIQDSRQDWEREAAQMASVYSNAHVTIAASASSDGRGGCQVDNEMRPFGPVDMEYASEAAGSAQVFRLWSRASSPVGQVLAQDALTRRGWTLQERELSPRVAHYSKDTIRWECRELWATLEFPWGDGASFDVGRLFDGGSSARPTTFGEPINNSKTLDDATKQRLSWFELVSRYTSRALTKQSDILPAFSGIARTIAESTSDEYCAGLWKSFFAHCLLWAANWHVNRGISHHSRPSTYLAPSWSWASVRGPVHYLSWVNGYWYTFNAHPDSAFVPSLVNVSLQPSSDVYGAVNHGLLTIQGKVNAAFSKQEALADTQDRLSLWGPGPTGSAAKVGEIRYDIPLCQACAPLGSIRVVWLLCCMNGQKFSDGSFRTFALALEDHEFEDGQGAPMTVPGRYRRVGVAWGIDPSFWERGTTATLTIA